MRVQQREPTVIQIQGPIDTFYEKVRPEIEGTEGAVVVDMSRNTTISARGLVDLILMYDHLAKEGRRMALCNVPQDIRLTMALSHPSDAFDKYRSVDEAIESITAQAQSQDYTSLPLAQDRACR